MQSETPHASIPKARLWTGRVISVLLALLLLFDGVMKFVQPPEVVEATTGLGYSESVILPLGAVVIVCTVLYLVPPTAVVGAILLTGYLGGAVASHLRAGGSWFEIFFPAIFGALLWLGLVLRDERLCSLVPWRRDR